MENVMESINAEAKKLFLTDYANELQANGVLPPTKNKDPIFPPWGEIEYEAMEKDTAKYLLYYAAIYMALKAWQPAAGKLNIMVLGAGRGRLVQYCLDSLVETNHCGVVHVIEANVRAQMLLKDKFGALQNVIVYDPIAIRTKEEIEKFTTQNSCDKQLKGLILEKPIDLFVSELFGSFADNEFIGEILSSCVDLFAKRSSNGNLEYLSIPQSFTTYACLIHSQQLDELFQTESRQQVYVSGLPKDTLFLTELVPVYHHLCTESILQETHEQNIKPLNSTSSNITAIAGYFKAKLYEDIYIDTRPTVLQNTFFWEAAIFPINPMCQLQSSITFKISRNCRRVNNKQDHNTNIKYPVLKMWYEWGIDEMEANKNGSNHTLFL